MVCRGSNAKCSSPNSLRRPASSELAARWGVSMNTLLSRKRYAVLALRDELQEVYDEWLNELSDFAARK